MPTCSRCQRHLLEHAAACPFCGAARRPVFRRRLAGLMLVSAIGLTAGGCFIVPAPVYGPAPPPSASPAGESPAPVPPYGVAPPPEVSPSPERFE